MNRHCAKVSQREAGRSSGGYRPGQTPRTTPPDKPPGDHDGLGAGAERRLGQLGEQRESVDEATPPPVQNQNGRSATTVWPV